MTTKLSHIPAVDSLRIVCAFIVFGLHLYGLPILGAVDRLNTKWPQYAEAWQGLLTFNRGLFDGAAAVIAFFIISGICIHWPERSRPLRTGPFLVRRLVRVALPMIVVLLVAQLWLQRIDFLDAVLWSLYCELIYYCLYPLLRYCAERIGWTPLVVVATLIACGIVAQPDTGHGYFFAYGHAITWLIGLPVWLVGVWVAQHVNLCAPALSRARLNTLRFGIWLLAAVAIIAHDHQWLTFKWSLLIFTLPAAFWIVCEIRNGYHNGTVGWLERAGAWSFSLYLSHKFVIVLLPLAGLQPRSVTGWLVAVPCGLVLALGFYYFIEQPTHRLARSLASRLTMANAPHSTANGAFIESAARSRAE